MNDAWLHPYWGLGFAGPDAFGRAYTELHGARLTVTALSEELVELTASIGDAHDTTVCDARWGVDRIRNTLGQVLERVLPDGESTWLRAEFALPVENSERITSAAMKTGSCQHFTVESLPLHPSVEYGLDYTLEHRAAMTTARHGTDPVLVGWIATEYPNSAVQDQALLNTSCPEEVLLGVAPDERAASVLLQRTSLPENVFQNLADAESARYMRSAMPRHHFPRLLRIALHPACPEELALGLVAHVVSPGGGARVSVATKAWEAAPGRRDAIHLYLLSGGRATKYTNALVDAVVGTHDRNSRIEWLRTRSRRLETLVDRWQGAHASMA
ncbi:hypothetical protein [Rhodococcus sp. NPDC058521]|uniref:hypothetical protein n=1 Tax=Rhodococcus sp. NPDC058521 TaxID=3346536 RepID=UPI003665AC46